MGIMDFFSDIMKSADEAASRKRPGQLCGSCDINDIRCKDCLAEQQKILDAIDEAQNLEQAINKLNSDPGAAASLRDLPTDKIEQDNLLLEKAAAISALYSAFYKRRGQESQESLKAALPSFLGGAVGLFGSIGADKMDMNEAEIKQYAKENNVSYCEYVIGVIQGTYCSPKQSEMAKQASAMVVGYAKNAQEVNERNREDAERRKLEEERRKLEAERRQLASERQAANRTQQVNYLERSRQIEAERQAELKKIQQERHQRELERIKNNAPQYASSEYSGGGGGSGAGRYCCGNCTHYMPATNECTEYSTWRPKGASDYCWKHRSR